MPGQEDLPPQSTENQNDNNGLSRTWHSQEVLMKMLEMGISTLKNFRKYYGLKSSKIGNRIRYNDDDVQDFLRRYRG